MIETDYIDVRDIHPGYTTIPCPDCDNRIRVDNHFAEIQGEWYCSGCMPQDLREIGPMNRVEVRL